MEIALAPLQGLTTNLFRKCWNQYFNGIDIAYSPFIPLTQGEKIKSSHLHDVISRDNPNAIPIVPQVLGNDPVQFEVMVKTLMTLGYDEINLNMGCPVKAITKKKRGCGLMPEPMMVKALLETVTKERPNLISVKLRLGMHSNDEIWPMLHLLNTIPLKKIIIHPRLGSQMYDGIIDLDTFQKVLHSTPHPIVYNGDIFTIENFLLLRTRFPTLNAYMLGRGVLRDPFLPAKIKGIIPPAKNTIREILYAFHQTLFETTMHQTTSQQKGLGKMKEFWSYFSFWFEAREEIWFTLSHTVEKENFIKTVNKIFTGRLAQNILQNN